MKDNGVAIETALRVAAVRFIISRRLRSLRVSSKNQIRPGKHRNIAKAQACSGERQISESVFLQVKMRRNGEKRSGLQIISHLLILSGWWE
jgi:hypothetical protein